MVIHFKLSSVVEDRLWACIMKAVPKLDKSESGLMVLKMWNWLILMHIYHKQNVESYKKFNEKTQTANFSNLTRQHQELCAQNAKNNQN